MNAQVLSQVTSGRWILTVMTGISFMGFVGANCYLACIGKPMVEPGAMVSIITAVVLSYFNKTATPAVTPDPVPTASTPDTPELSPSDQKIYDALLAARPSFPVAQATSTPAVVVTTDATPKA